MRKRSSLERRNILPTFPVESFLNVSSLQMDFKYSAWLISSSSCTSLQNWIKSAYYIIFLSWRRLRNNGMNTLPETQGTVIFPFKLSNGSRWKMFNVPWRVSNPVLLCGFHVLACYLLCTHFPQTPSLSLSASTRRYQSHIFVCFPQEPYFDPGKQTLEIQILRDV